MSNFGALSAEVWSVQYVAVFLGHSVVLNNISNSCRWTEVLSLFHKATPLVQEKYSHTSSWQRQLCTSDKYFQIRSYAFVVHICSVQKKSYLARLRFTPQLLLFGEEDSGEFCLNSNCISSTESSSNKVREPLSSFVLKDSI